MHFPDELMALPAFGRGLDARQLQASACDVLFASYRQGQSIAPHRHDTHNVGVVTQGELLLTQRGREQRYGVGQWYRIERAREHAARFEQDTSIIEFWFRGTEAMK
jgi:quercetin dioxygenase-like cupin family protein